MMYRTLPPVAPIAYTETDKLIMVAWPEVERILGHPWGMVPEDDAILYAALAAIGVPYTDCMGGWPDQDLGWVLQKPLFKKRRR